MRILQVIPTLNATAGGPVEGLIQQGVVMTRAGHDVQTVCVDAAGSQVDSRLQSSAVYQLGPKIGGYSFAWRLEPWLRENIQKFDVVIVHGIWTYHSFCVGKVARDLKVPYVVFLHGMLDSYFARAFPLKHAKKWVYWPWAEYRVLRDAAYVLFTTQEELLLARQSFWLYKARERFVGYGIRDREISRDTAKSAFLGRFPHLAKTRNLLYLSRLHPKKGPDLAIRSFAKVAARYPDLHLILAGPGDEHYVRGLKELAISSGVDQRVTFTGMLRDEIKWGAYDIAEAFLLPSHQENFGIVIAEALASGVPVLTTKQVNIWREIEADRAGVIGVDTQEGSDGLLDVWLSKSDGQKTAMRDAARQCFLANFHVDNVTKNLMAALSDATAQVAPEHTFIGSLLKSEH